jgi:hypothetical protein
MGARNAAEGHRDFREEAVRLVRETDKPTDEAVDPPSGTDHARSGR